TAPARVRASRTGSRGARQSVGRRRVHCARAEALGLRHGARLQQQRWRYRVSRAGPCSAVRPFRRDHARRSAPTAREAEAGGAPARTIDGCATRAGCGRDLARLVVRQLGPLPRAEAVCDAARRVRGSDLRRAHDVGSGCGRCVRGACAGPRDDARRAAGSMSELARRWWRGELGVAGSALDVVMAPAEVVYRVATSLRQRAHALGLLRTRDPALPVISIGNIAVGGSGKTPFTSWLAQRMAARGARPAIVHGGYADDEPELHRMWTPQIPVIVDRDRVRAARTATQAG